MNSFTPNRAAVAQMLFHQRPRIAPRRAVLLLVDLQVRCRRPCPAPRPSDICAAAASSHIACANQVLPKKYGSRPSDVHQLFAIEQHEVDADWSLQLRHQVRKFHQHGHAARAVVRADEHALAPLAPDQDRGRAAAACRSAHRAESAPSAPDATRRSCSPSAPCRRPADCWPETLESSLCRRAS